MKRLLLPLLLIPMHLCSIEFLKDYLHYSNERPLPAVDNDLIYGDGSTELTTQINEYENIQPNKPIKGTIFVTHNGKNTVEESSFRLGDQPFKVSLVSSNQISSTSPIVVTIYKFQLGGMPPGTHTLPPIHVKVGGKDIQALPLIIQVPQQQ